MFNKKNKETARKIKVENLTPDAQEIKINVRPLVTIEKHEHRINGKVQAPLSTLRSEPLNTQKSMATKKIKKPRIAKPPKNRALRQFKAYVIKHVRSPKIVRGGLYEDRLEMLKVWDTIPRWAHREYEQLEVVVSIKTAPKRKKAK